MGGSWEAGFAGNNLGRKRRRPTIVQPGSAPFCPKGCYAALRGALPGTKFSVGGRRRGWGGGCNWPCPSPAPRDWRRAWKQADPVLDSLHSPRWFDPSRLRAGWWRQTGGRSQSSLPPDSRSHPALLPSSYRYGAGGELLDRLSPRPHIKAPWRRGFICVAGCVATSPLLKLADLELFVPRKLGPHRLPLPAPFVNFRPVRLEPRAFLEKSGTLFKLELQGW